MLIFSILLLILSNAVTLRRDKSILYSRVVIIALLYSSLLAINTLFITSLGTGIGLHGGLFHIINITHIFHIFIFLISATILRLTTFYSCKVGLAGNLIKLIYYSFLYCKCQIINKMGEQFKVIVYPLILLCIMIGAFLASTMKITILVHVDVFIFYLICLDLNYISISLALVGLLTVIILLLIFLHPTFKHNYPILYKSIWIISISLFILIISYFLIQYYWNGFVFTGRGGGGPSGTPQLAGPHGLPVNPTPGGPNKMAIGNMVEGNNGDTIYTYDGKETSVNYILHKLKAQYRINRIPGGPGNHPVSWDGYRYNSTLNLGDVALNPADIALVKAKIATDFSPEKRWEVLPSGRYLIDKIKLITPAGRASGNFHETPATKPFITYFERFK